MDVLFETLDESLCEFEALGHESQPSEVIAEGQTGKAGEVSDETVDSEAALKRFIVESVFEDLLNDPRFIWIDHPDTVFIDPFFQFDFEYEEDDYELPKISQDLYRDFSFEKFIDVQEEIDELRVKNYLKMCKILDTPPITNLIKSLEMVTLNLKYRRINSRSMRAMVEVLASNQYIQNVDLSHVTLEPMAAYFLSEILFSNNTIRDLNLSWCRLGPVGMKQMKMGFIECALTKLDLSNNSIGDDGMRHLSEALSVNTFPRSLILRRNGLGEESARLLAKCLRYNRHLEHLDVSWNRLYPEQDLRELLESVAMHGTLSSLDASWNGLRGPAVGQALRDALLNSRTLKALNIANNLLSSEEVALLSAGLATNTVLETLDVGHNGLSADDCKVLLRAISTSAVRSLDLGAAWVDKQFLQMLEEATEKRQINVIFNRVSGDYVIHGPDVRKLHLSTARHQAQAPRVVRNRRDFGHFLFRLGDGPMDQKKFTQMLGQERISLEAGLATELMKAFEDSSGAVDVVAMRQFYLQMYPATQPPPARWPPRGRGRGRRKPN